VEYLPETSSLAPTGHWHGGLPHRRVLCSSETHRARLRRSVAEPFLKPALVWCTRDGALWGQGLLRENRRPSETTKLSFAPYWNTSESGTSVLGSMRPPDVSTVASIPQWGAELLWSEFTHATWGGSRSTRAASRAFGKN